MNSQSLEWQHRNYPNAIFLKRWHVSMKNKPTESNVNYDLEFPEISNLGSLSSINSFRFEAKSVKEPCTTPTRKKVEDRYT